MRNIALLSAALLLSTMPFASASAQTSSVEVHTADLNLASDAGRAVLQWRITRAIEAVCGTSDGRLTLQTQAALTSCSQSARAAAAPKVDAMVEAARSKVAVDRNHPASVQSLQ